MTDLESIARRAIELAGKATKGTWEWMSPENEDQDWLLQTKTIHVGEITSQADTEWIAFAREALQALAAACRELMAETMQASSFGAGYEAAREQAAVLADEHYRNHIQVTGAGLAIGNEIRAMEPREKP